MEKLQVPANITLRWELMPGVGKKEAVAIAITAIVAVAAGILFCAIADFEGDTMAAVFGVVITVAAAYSFFARLDGTQSIFDYLQRQARYKREQQTYYYVRKEGAYVAKKDGSAGY